MFLNLIVISIFCYIFIGNLTKCTLYKIIIFFGIWIYKIDLNLCTIYMHRNENYVETNSNDVVHYVTYISK